MQLSLLEETSLHIRMRRNKASVEKGTRGISDCTVHDSPNFPEHSLQLDLLMEYAIVQIKNKKLCNAGESSIFLPTGK